MRRAGPPQASNSAPKGASEEREPAGPPQGRTAERAARSVAGRPRAWGDHTIAPRPRIVTLFIDVALLAACIAAAAWVALASGQDANWDLQNYHFYDPWAWVHGRTFDRDIAAAQLQTFHAPF